MVKTNKGNVMILILAAVVVVGVGYWYVTTKQAATSEPEPTPTVTPTETAIDTSNWKTYTDEELGISFMYPPEMEYSPEIPQEKFIIRGPAQLNSSHIVDGLLMKLDGKTLVDDVDLHQYLVDSFLSDAETIEKYVSDIQISGFRVAFYDGPIDGASWSSFEKLLYIQKSPHEIVWLSMVGVGTNIKKYRTISETILSTVSVSE